MISYRPSAMSISDGPALLIFSSGGDAESDFARCAAITDPAWCRQHSSLSLTLNQMPQQPFPFRPVAQAGFPIDMSRRADIDKPAAP